jgi:hypothetical protein
MLKQGFGLAVPTDILDISIEPFERLFGFVPSEYSH